MRSWKGCIALLCTLGIYATGPAAFGASEPSSTNATSSQDAAKDKSLTSVILSFFGQKENSKNTAPEAILLEKPSAENADQYIKLSEPDTTLTFQGPAKPGKKITVQHSFAVKPSLIFNMGTSGLSRSPLSTGNNSRAVTSGNQLTFSYGKEGTASHSKAIDISLGSQFLSEPSSVLSPLYDSSEYDLLDTRQVYNLSLDVGYAGFTVGASFSREKLLHDQGMKGFDIGFGYTGEKWGAGLKFGEYKRERDRLFASIEEFYDTTYAVELGAAYHLNSNVRFTGRFTYYSYGQENEIEQLRNSQVFFLGTNVNF